MRALSVLLARLIGGESGETLSALSGRCHPRLAWWIDYFLISPGHCRRAHEKHMTEQTSTNEPPRVAMAFTPDAVAMILEGLGHLPLARAKPLYDAIERQAQEQLAPKKE